MSQADSSPTIKRICYVSAGEAEQLSSLSTGRAADHD
jgi:hypothetical protein